MMIHRFAGLLLVRHCSNGDWEDSDRRNGDEGGGDREDYDRRNGDGRGWGSHTQNHNYS